MQWIDEMLASSLAASLRFFLATTSSKLLGVSCTLMGVCLVSSQGKCVAASLFLPDVRVAAKDRPIDVQAGQDQD